MSKPAPGGYSLEQLLKWCVHDRLIDGYDRSADGVVIFEGGSRHELDPSEARSYLKSIFTSTHRDQDPDNPNLA